jgi:serine/threonine protein kinase
MAPEQWSGERPTPSLDLYALGCVLYELVTGRPPFPGPTWPAFMRQHLTQVPVPLRDRRPQVPAFLDTLVAGLLAKAPGDRPRSAAEVHAVLTRQSAGPVRVLPEVTLDTPVTAQPDGTGSQPDGTAKRPGGTRKQPDGTRQQWWRQSGSPG